MTADEREPWLPSGSEMGALIRDHDWLRTPLGAMTGWSSARRGAVARMLRSTTPVALFWGSDGIATYNDAFRDTVGLHRASALGASVHKLWRDASNRAFLELVDEVHRGRTSRSVISLPMLAQREAFSEATFCDVSCDAILRPDGDVDGVMCIVVDTTTRTLAERRLHTLRALSGRAWPPSVSVNAHCQIAAELVAGNPHDVAYALIYLTDDDGRNVELAGSAGIAAESAMAPQRIVLSASRDEHVGWAGLMVSPTGDARVVDDMAERFGAVPGDAESARCAVLIPLMKAERLAGFLIAGISGHRLLDDAMRGYLDLCGVQLSATLAFPTALAARNGDVVREDRYRALVAAMEDGFCLAEVVYDDSGRAVDHRILEANPAFERHTGVQIERVLGDPIGQLASTLVPGGEPFWNELYARVASTGVSERVENGSDVMQRWFDVVVSRVGGDDSRTVAIVFEDVTARHLAQRALQHRTAQFETLLREAPLGVFLIDADFRVRELNADAQPTFAAISDVIGRDFDEVVHILWPRERADELVRQYRDTLATGVPFFAPDDSEVRYDSGVAEYYTWQINRITLPEGGYGVVCYFREISAQVKAVGRIKESEARYRELFDSAPMAVFSCERDGTILSFNPLAAELWGWKPACGVDRHPGMLRIWRQDGELVTPADDAKVDVLRTGEPARNLHLVIERPDGSRLPVLMNIAAQRTAAGEISGTISSFIDISERVRAEATMHDTQRQLRFVMDSMPQKIFTALADARIEYLNPQWEEYTGLTPEQIRDWTSVGLIHPDDLAHTVALWQHGFEHGEAIQIEHRFRRVDGEFHWHISRALPMHDADGHIVKWVGSSTDVHEQKQSESALQASTVAMIDADRRKDEFLALLAHELRNPLAPIRNALEIMRRSDGNAGIQTRAREILDRQTQQMIRLVDDLLDVSRISRGMLDLQRETIDLASILEQAVETVHPAILQAGQTLTVALPSHPLRMSGDAVRLVQVFGNLLNNASKFSASGGRIWLTVEQTAREIVVSVRDTGVGIPPHMLTAVFEMFRQVDDPVLRSRGGLGIGLSLVQRIVEMHGGTVTATSDGPSRGSEFQVRLPAVVVETPASLSADPSERVVALPVARRRVLVVDDNRDAAESLALFLELTDNDTRTASDGRAAIDTAREFLPDLVLMDIGMPILDGYQAARLIREEAWGKSMTLVALSGWGQETDRRQTADAGFTAHLVKPVDHVVLAALLASLPPRLPALQ